MKAAMLKVASYNMRKAVGTDRLRKPDRVLDVLAEIDADVVALQEADRRFGAREAALPAELLGRTAYAHVPLSPRSHGLGWHGNAILVKRAVEVIEYQHLDLPTIEPRGAVLVELRVGDLPLRVVGMHLDLSGLQRRRQARTIVAAIGRRTPMATVLMGDLNEWSLHGGCLREFADGYRCAPTGPSFHARRPVARLDRILVNGALQISASGVHRSSKAQQASDHLPIWARLARSDGNAAHEG